MHFLLIALATYRVVPFLMDEDGPWGVFRKMRSLYPKLGLEQVEDCYWCASQWAAVFVSTYYVVIAGPATQHYSLFLPILILAASGIVSLTIDVLDRFSPVSEMLFEQVNEELASEKEPQDELPG